MVKNVCRSSREVPLLLSYINYVLIFSADLRKILNIKFRENSCSGSRVVPYGLTDGQTYMTKSRFSHFCERAQRIQEHFVTFGTVS